MSNVRDGETITESTSGTLVYGHDGANVRSVAVDGSGRVFVRTFSDDVNATALDVSGNGDNTIRTPATGKALRLHYLSLSAPDTNASSVTVTLHFGVSATLYRINLAPGALWARNIGAGRRYLQGGINEALIANLSAARTVSVSVEYEEVT